MIARLFSAALVLLAGAFPVFGDELKNLSGKSVTGTLASVSDLEIVVDTKDGPVATPISQVLLVELSGERKGPSPTRYFALRLLDDAVLHATDVKFAGKELHATLTSGAVLKLPMSAVVWFVRDAEKSVLRQQFEELAARKVRRDRVVILREGQLNPLEGTIGDSDAEGKTVPFKRDGAEPLPIQLDRLHGMIFYRTENPAEPPIVKVFDRDGNVLTAVKLAYQDKKWQVTTPYGVSLPLPEGAVAKLDFNLGKLTYLSDLEPTKVIESRWGETKDVIYPYRKDANLSGEPIMLPERFAKGLAMHALTELHYDLGGKYKELRGILGVETRSADVQGGDP